MNPPAPDPTSEEGTPSFTLKVRCGLCGTVQEVAVDAREATCKSCSEPLPGAADAAASAPAGRPGPEFQLTAKTRETLVELMKHGPGPEILAVVMEILNFHRRLASLAAFVPFLGPWLVARSEDRPEQKRKLLYGSVGLTILATLGLAALLWRTSAPPVPLPERVQSQIRVLGEIAEAFRNEHGTYPDAATWKRTADQPDRRFFDPWSHPYRYQHTQDGGVTIGTLGRDGAAGGTGDDADVSIHFAPPGPSTASRRE